MGATNGKHAAPVVLSRAALSGHTAALAWHQLCSRCTAGQQQSGLGLACAFYAYRRDPTFMTDTMGSASSCKRPTTESTCREPAGPQNLQKCLIQRGMARLPLHAGPRARCSSASSLDALM